VTSHANAVGITPKMMPLGRARIEICLILEGIYSFSQFGMHKMLIIAARIAVTITR
jgi:hypothetical protein